MVGFRDVQQFNELLGSCHFKMLPPHTHHKPNGNEKAKDKAVVCFHGCFLANLEKQSVITKNMHTKKKREKTSFKHKGTYTGTKYKGPILPFTLSLMCAIT